MPSKPRVLLADDHESVLCGARALLELEFDVVGAVSDGEALVQAAEELKPDVIYIGTTAVGLSGEVPNSVEFLMQEPRLPHGGGITPRLMAYWVNSAVVRSDNLSMRLYL